MKKIKSLIIGLGLISTCAFNLVSIDAAWIKDSNGWWNSEGSSWSIGWRNINNEWYYFGTDGYMKTGWIQDKDKWYYLDTNGAMAKNTTIDGYCLGNDGAWIKDYLNEVDDKDNVIFKTEQETYNLGTEEIKTSIINNSGKEQRYGEYFSVEKFENNKWNKLEFSNQEFDDICCIIHPNRTNCKVYDLTRIKNFKNLKSGKYRIVNCINGVNKTAEFELK